MSLHRYTTLHKPLHNITQRHDPCLLYAKIGSTYCFFLLFLKKITYRCHLYVMVIYTPLKDLHFHAAKPLSKPSSKTMSKSLYMNTVCLMWYMWVCLHVLGAAADPFSERGWRQCAAGWPSLEVCSKDTVVKT